MALGPAVFLGFFHSCDRLARDRPRVTRSDHDGACDERVGHHHGAYGTPNFKSAPVCATRSRATSLIMLSAPTRYSGPSYVGRSGCSRTKARKSENWSQSSPSSFEHTGGPVERAMAAANEASVGDL